MSDRNAEFHSQQHARHISRSTEQIGAVDFFNLLTGPQLLEMTDSLLPEHRERLYAPTLALSMFMGQVLSEDGSCQTGIHFSPMMARKTKQMSPAGEDTFGQRLARLRKAAGISQEQLAKHLGTAQTLISEYEHDNRRVHGERLSTIAHLLHVSVDELLGHKPSKANGAASLKLVRRLKAIEALPPQRQKFVLQTLDALLRDSTRHDD